MFFLNLVLNKYNLNKIVPFAPKELPPAFPANKGSFLVTTDRSRGRLPLFVDTEMLLTGPQNGNGSAAGRFYRHSASPPDRSGGAHILNRYVHTHVTRRRFLHLTLFPNLQSPT
jgi:hypothetical protein